MAKTFKMVRLVGEAPDSIEAAVGEALSTSAETVRGQNWLQIADIRANVGESGSVDMWQVTIDLAFEVERG